MTGVSYKRVFSLIAVCSAATAGLHRAHAGSPLDPFINGAFHGKFRTYYINREFNKIGGEPERRIQESLAAGGWLGYETAAWSGLSLGAVIYTSQGVLVNNPNFGGGGILGPDNESYSSLGQAYLQYLLKNTTLRLYRQGINSPFINDYDTKMTPRTWEAYTLYNRDIPDVTLTTSFIRQIKGWYETDFQYMGEFANNNGTYQVTKTNIPVSLAGAVWTPADNYKFQLWDYFAYEYFNGAYLQGNASWPLTDDGLSLGLALQGWTQRSAGEEVGGDFSTCFGGGEIDLGWKCWTISLIYTVTDRGSRVVNPWGNSFSFASIFEEDFDYAGEEAFVVGLEYDFSETLLDGLTASVYVCNGDTPASGPGATPSQKEYDFFIKYRPDPDLEGLHLKIEGAVVDTEQSFPEGEDYHDIRFIFNYDFGFGIKPKT
ncbi:MAG: OprD family outer membrane porin [PVC group bacterium]